MKSGGLAKGIILYFLLLMLMRPVFAQTRAVSRNDHIFPAAESAQPFINYDARGFLINGKRTFIASAGMEYARVPRALWADRLIRLKRGGYNAVEIYTFWNYHEPKEGQFNFAGDHDLDAFLKLVKKMGLYAIVRVGPYYCGEWNMGGFPIWLRFKPGLRVREDNPQFITAVDQFFDKLIPIVSANQISSGGAVIMVQLENEHRAAWGTITPNGYFKHLIEKTVSLGIVVPYFFSGLHPGNDPAGDVSNLDDLKRPNPWFSTEYWGVWFLNYGSQPQDSAIYDRRTWKIIAHGGNGYNVYMAHGGTNFDYNNDRDMAASYDYGASVGQAGDLRPLYYSFKKANWFARSFQDVLANSTDFSDDNPTVSDTTVKVTSRQSPAGTIAFLNNPDSTAVSLRLSPPTSNAIKVSVPVKLAPNEIMPVVLDYQLTPAVKLAWAPTRIYGITQQGQTTTILVYGDAGSTTSLYFEIWPNAKVLRKSSSFKIDDEHLTFHSRIAADAPSVYSFDVNGRTIRVITVNNDFAMRSWFIEADGQNYLLIGPEYAGDHTITGSSFSLAIEKPWEAKGLPNAWLFGPGKQMGNAGMNTLPVKHVNNLNLNAWQAKAADQNAQADYDDGAWMLSRDPLQMGADGDITANAWYRTKLTVDRTGEYKLQFKNVLDRAALFLNGIRIDTGEVFNKIVKIKLRAGQLNTLALLTSHDGRNKLIFKVGEIDTIDAKGITGQVTLQKADGMGPVITVNNWRIKGGPGDPFGTTGWKPLTAAKTNTPRFYRTSFAVPVLKGTTTTWRVNTTSLSYGSVWVNGHNIGRYPEKIKIGGHYIPECWLKAGVNTLVIFDENGARPDKVSVQAEVAAGRDTQLLQFK